jgi:hypothetical protein
MGCYGNGSMPLGLISHKARIGVDKGQPGRGSEA